MDNKNIKKIETPTLIIDENVLKYKDSIIQISNVTKCEVAPEPKIQYPIWAIVGTPLSILLIYMHIITLGIILLLICATIIFIIFCLNLSPDTYFTLELNSGSTVLFSSHDNKFLLEAQKAVMNCFNHKEKTCIINFSECTISHSQIGKSNIIN